jgi:hypothetical protein
MSYGVKCCEYGMILSRNPDPADLHSGSWKTKGMQILLSELFFWNKKKTDTAN